MLVYDRSSDQAHCLKATAARVWAHCDGRTMVAEKAVGQLSRRVMVRRLGIAAAVTVPLVTSIVAPTAAATGILGQPGATFVHNGDCCSNSWVNNGRRVFQCT